MRHIIKLTGFAIICCLTAIVSAQVGTSVVDGTIRIPRDAVFGDAFVPAGSYELSLVEIDRETWFVLTKDGQEVVRDLAIEMSAREYPVQGLKTEVLRGEEYFRVRVRRGDKVYLIHFLLKRI